MTVKEFFFSLPQRVSSDKLQGVETRFHFEITGSGNYTLKISDGTLSVAEGLQGEASCVVKISEENMEKILSKELNPMTAVFTGKLKISNPSELIRYAAMLGLA